ncbi:hypothetical protein amb0987 [Paramagnetospirillum magneticum AMB-1]|uniref:Uncharacterized protein n=1 Tax=Paramagnetospirillum magneticum (strain ATCC 700264 / AMB-1) TaxID=342108 RepID=Q2W8N4_PARM1|nr:hypothetical protein amb0987 [Paramagnetospirillum magneticum AMB-1]
MTSPARMGPNSWGHAAFTGARNRKGRSVAHNNAFGFEEIRRAVNSAGWLRLLLVVAIGLTVAILFVHLFVAIAVGALCILFVHHAVQRAMGPGTRIRLRMPPAMSARLKGWMWRK